MYEHAFPPPFGGEGSLAVCSVEDVSHPNRRIERQHNRFNTAKICLYNIFYGLLVNNCTVFLSKPTLPERRVYSALGAL